MLVVDIPESILIYIYFFLCCGDDSRQDKNARRTFPHFASGGKGKRNELNWQRFVNTTNRFQELKHHTLYLSLDQIHSERFFTDRGYRALMKKLF
jgi:hypothetical protein